MIERVVAFSLAHRLLVAFAVATEGDVVPARGDEQAEQLGVDAGQRLDGALEERHRAVGAEARLAHEDAVEFEEEALLVWDLGHRVIGVRSGLLAPMASAR